MTDTGNHKLDDLAPERLATDRARPSDDRAEGDDRIADENRHLADDEKHDHLADKVRGAENRQEALIDEGVEETFPASDPATPKRIT
jgi:hypothetical protein